ncbi:PaaI family thioesterase [Halorarius litoreus]|uniref:PaaI family thioesterase n=1 Tax=Halorarius litoreus TaxID=2962676 RepID=UPI0020CE3126|nr:PaaI family thioesterase [Halorarius litoreus]
MSDDHIPEGAAEAVQHYFDTRHEFLSWLGVQVEELAYGRAVMSIPYDRKLTNVPWAGADANDRPPIQGGIASTLIDTVGGIALRGHLTDPVNDGVATINLNVNYLQQATDDLTATAEVIRAGDTVGVADVLVESTHDGETVPVAIGQGAYRLFKS